MSFWTFNQNNSGGDFDDPAHNVIVEASTAQEAVSIAEDKAGVYFNGVASGQDCGCCGDRWSDDPNEEEVVGGWRGPLVDGMVSDATNWGLPEYAVFYANGISELWDIVDGRLVKQPVSA